jgi:hypothetical protein
MTPRSSARCRSRSRAIAVDAVVIASPSPEIIEANALLNARAAQSSTVESDSGRREPPRRCLAEDKIAPRNHRPCSVMPSSPEATSYPERSLAIFRLLFAPG